MDKKELLFEIRDLNIAIARAIMKEKRVTNSSALAKEKNKITPTQFRIIKYLTDNAKKVVSQKDIERHLGISRASVSGVLDTMEKHNIIKREISLTDSRSKNVILQKHTLKKMQEAKKHFKKISDQLSANLTKEEVKDFTKIAGKMIVNLSEKKTQKEDKNVQII